MAAVPLESMRGHSQMTNREDMDSALTVAIDNGDTFPMKENGHHTCFQAWCSTTNASHITTASKRRQMIKMVFLILSPILMLMPVSLYFVVDNIRQKNMSDVVRNAVLFSTELGSFVHTLQKERDMSVLYLSSLGPETKTFLNTRYLDTDEHLDSLTDWPVNIDRQRRSYFQTKRVLQRHLTRHRNEIAPTDNIFKEVTFYSDIIGVFVRWMYDAITESKFGIVWKVLVAYQKVVIAKEELAMERAIGTAFFSQGRFLSDDVYRFYNAKYHVYKSTIEAALQYAPFLATDFKEELDLLYILQKETSEVTSNIMTYRRIIQSRGLEKPSLTNATRFYDNMSFLIDEHLVVQKAISTKIINNLDKRSVEMTTGVIISSLVILIVLAMCPVLVRMVQRLTDNIQSYALTLADRTNELNIEKKRTDSLLYQMLPKPVAEQLKRRQDVRAEFYKEVTIFFSDIVGFTRLSGECSPMDIVNMLNDIYTVFDQRIGLYDVYKVETIGDSYMVASGLPNRNGSRHASEIAKLSLDLIASCGEVEMPLMPGRSLRIRVGLHSGQCVAGVVGLKLPRYCLFGDTVNTASRMETHGLPNRIHCSASTYKLLNRTGSYVFQSRGTIFVKGKGQMTTYFLLGKRESFANNAEEDRRASDTSYRDRKTSANSTDPKPVAGPDEKPHRVSIPACKEAPIAEKGEESSKRPADRASIFKPPSYQDLERELSMQDPKDPPIFKVVEGYHF